MPTDRSLPAAPDFATLRRRMIDEQIAGRGIRSPAVVAAMRIVPRERFVDPLTAASAYDDGPLPIGEGQTISQPFIVAAMLEAANVTRGAFVLEVGAGSGYAAAVMAEMGARVCAIERIALLAEAARDRLTALGHRNVDLRVGDGTLGWPEDVHFDAVVVSAGGMSVPLPLKAQLALGGRLVMPVGKGKRQRLRKLTRLNEAEFMEEDLAGVAFVPLVGGAG